MIVSKGKCLRANNRSSPYVGQEKRQQSASKHINLHTRIKRLVCRTIGFAKPERMHEFVRGLLSKRYTCGRLLSSAINIFEISPERPLSACASVEAHSPHCGALQDGMGPCHFLGRPISND
jgi:hypothetical protein